MIRPDRYLMKYHKTLDLIIGEPDKTTWYAKFDDVGFAYNTIIFARRGCLYLSTGGAHYLSRRYAKRYIDYPRTNYKKSDMFDVMRAWQRLPLDPERKTERKLMEHFGIEYT